MEANSMNAKEDEDIELPPGFRFHPTDEELITHYLSRKVIDNCFCARAIGEVDLNKCEPWDLHRRAKMGEKEWYFFSVKDRKYPTGLRTNRATDAGYWKATGKDKEIYKAKTLVGMKKTLVFYRGRAPKGEKTNWVMHEYRLEGKYSLYNLPKTARNEWVICRFFKKSSAGKKIQISGSPKVSTYGQELRPTLLPPLTDSSPHNTSETRTKINNIPHVTCFSKPVEGRKLQEDSIVASFNSSCILASSSSLNMPPASVHLSKTSFQSPFYLNQSSPTFANLQYANSALLRDQSILRLLFEDHGKYMSKSTKMELSPDTGFSNDMSSGVTNHELAQEDPSISGGAVDLDCLWNC